MTKRKFGISVIISFFLGLLISLSVDVNAANETRIRQDLIVQGAVTAQNTLGVTGITTLNGKLVLNSGMTSNSKMEMPAQTVSSAGNITALALTRSFLDFSSASSKDLHGIVAGSDGTMVVLYNSGAGILTLKHASVTEVTAVNRLQLFGAEDVELASGQGVVLMYLASASRWIVIGGTGGGGGGVSSAYAGTFSSSTLTLDPENGFQHFYFTGSSDVTLSATPFGAASPTNDRTSVTITGSSDTNLVTIAHTDSTKGTVLNGSAQLGKGDSITFVWIESMDRWVEISRNF